MLSIRSQNRISLVPYDTTVSIVHMIDSDYAVVVDYGDAKKNKLLGLYHSKERALEVLDEIELLSNEVEQILKHTNTYHMPKE